MGRTKKARSNASLRRELVDPKIAEHHGRVVKPAATACWWNFRASLMPAATAST
jgi:hypothetical protein